MQITPKYILGEQKMYSSKLDEELKRWAGEKWREWGRGSVIPSICRVRNAMETTPLEVLRLWPWFNTDLQAIIEAVVNQHAVALDNGLEIQCVFFPELLNYLLGKELAKLVLDETNIDISKIKNKGKV